MGSRSRKKRSFLSKAIIFLFILGLLGFFFGDNGQISEKGDKYKENSTKGPLFDAYVDANVNMDLDSIIPSLPDSLNPFNYDSFYTYYFKFIDAKEKEIINEEQAGTIANYMSEQWHLATDNCISFEKKKPRVGKIVYIVSLSGGLAAVDYGVGYDKDYGKARISEENGEIKICINWKHGGYMDLYYKAGAKTIKNDSGVVFNIIEKNGPRDYLWGALQ